MAQPIPSSFPISLRPSAEERSTSTALSDLIARINVERKGFRYVSEMDLMREVEEVEKHVSRPRDEFESEVDSKEEDQQGSFAFVAKKRAEMVTCLSQAGMEAQFALDSVSLLASNYTSQAKSSISTYVSANLPLSVYSYDKWDASKLDLKKKEGEAVVMNGSTAVALTTSADSLLKAATALEKHVMRETQYWAQVLSLRNEGWPLYKQPRDRRTTVVQFSASEAGPLFKDRGIAPLRVDGDGIVRLDQRLSLRPKSLRVRCFESGKFIGSSATFSAVSALGFDAPLDQTARRARDSLFDEELYHEMSMESRVLQSMGVTVRDGVINIPSSSHPCNVEQPNWVIELVSSDDSPDDKTPLNERCELAATILRLLLSHLHQRRLRHRSQLPPPLAERKGKEDSAYIIRPFMAMLYHYQAYQPLHDYLFKSSQILRSAGFSVDVQMSTVPALTDILAFVDSSKRANYSPAILDDLMEGSCRPLKTTASLALRLTRDSFVSTGHTSDDFTFELMTNTSSPPFGSEYSLSLIASFSTSMQGRMSLPTSTVPKRLVFSSLEELKDYSNNSLAMSVMRNAVRSRYTGWRHPDPVLPELSKVVELKSSKGEMAFGFSLDDRGLEAYQKWVCEDQQLQKHVWNGEDGAKNVVDVMDDWLKDVTDSVYNQQSSGLQLASK